MLSSECYADVLGIILTGGLSSRMGQDKASLVLEDGVSFLEHTWQLLGRCVQTRLLVTRSSTFSSSYSCLEDACERHGPAGGIMTALRFAHASHFSSVLALACDLPLLTEATLRHLLRARAQRPPHILLTAYADSNGCLESLCAVYEKDALPCFEAALTRGQYSLRTIIDESQQLRLPMGEEEQRSLYNVNTPEDLARARDFFAAIAP